jgi:hypothetical protein
MGIGPLPSSLGFWVNIFKAILQIIYRQHYILPKNAIRLSSAAHGQYTFNVAASLNNSILIKLNIMPSIINVLKQLF